MDAPLYNKEGKEAGTVALPAAVFAAKWNADLVRQVVLAMQANARAGTAHTKDRGDVRGGGRKPWKQKGTGRARHGSRRSPLWRGGGTTFGPRSEKDYSQKANRMMRAKALYAVLSKKYQDGEVLFVDSLPFAAPKTKDAKAVLAALSGVKGFSMLLKKRKNSAVIALPGNDAAAKKSFKNFGNILVEEARSLNPVDALTYKHLVIVNPEKTVEMLEKRAVHGRKVIKK
jgi:large subunit ribosomal protein L4